MFKYIRLGYTPDSHAPRGIDMALWLLLPGRIYVARSRDC